MRPVHVCMLLSIWASLGCGEPTRPPPETLDTKIHLLLTGAPACGLEAMPEVMSGLTKVLVTFNRVDVYSEDRGGWGQVLDHRPAGRTIDLLALRDGRTEELGAFQLPPGTYDRIWLLIDAGNQVEVDEGAGPQLLPLDVSSSEQTEIKLSHPFTVTGTGPTELVINFDIGLSVRKMGTEWRLEPALEIVSTTTEDAATLKVGPAGGTVRLPDKARVDVPPGALSACTEMSIKTVKLAPEQAAEQGVMPSSLVELGPAGQRFNMPVQLIIWYDRLEQRGRPEADMAFVSREPGHGWVRRPATWDTHLGTCTVTLSQLAIAGAGFDIKRIDPLPFGGLMDPGLARDVEVTYWDNKTDPKSRMYGVETDWTSSDPTLTVTVPERDCATRSRDACTRDVGCYFMGPECITDRRIASVTPVRYPGGTITVTPNGSSLAAITSAAIRGLRVRFHDFYVQDDSDDFDQGELYWRFWVNEDLVVNQHDWQRHGTGDTVPLLDQTSGLLALSAGDTFRLKAFFGEDESGEPWNGGADEAWFDHTYGWSDVGLLPNTNTDTNNLQGTLDIHLRVYLERVPE